MSSFVMRENVRTHLGRQKKLVSMTVSVKVLSLNRTTEIDEVPDNCFKNIRENGHVQINVCLLEHTFVRHV